MKSSMETRLEVAAIISALEQERDDAVSWIHTVLEELVLAGGARGDRTVGLANLRALIRQRDAYWPYVEAVAKQRYPFKAEDEIDAYDMLRERERAARDAKSEKGNT